MVNRDKKVFVNKYIIIIVCKYFNFLCHTFLDLKFLFCCYFISNLTSCLKCICYLFELKSLEFAAYIDINIAHERVIFQLKTFFHVGYILCHTILTDVKLFRKSS